MVYYDQPAKFAPGLEDQILATAHELMPTEYAAHYRADVPPKSPAVSLATIQTREGLVVELAAVEPFVTDPVAIIGRKFDFLGAGFMAGRNGMEGVQGEEGGENGAERSGLLDFQQWIKQGCQKSWQLVGNLIS